MTTTSPEEELGRAHAGRALGWSLLNTGAARFGTIAIGIVLARLLGPEEFGTFAVALVALLALLSFNELGVSLAVVRWREDPVAIAPTVATLSVATSAVLTVASVLLAPSLASAMGDPGATRHVQLLSLCVLVNGLVATPAALLQRYFRQRQRMVADQVNVWSGAIVSVVMALLGFGAISLVVGRLVGAILSALLFWKYSPLPFRFGFDRGVARALLRFGLPLAGASMVVFLVGFVDQMLVGHLLGPVVLGAYVLAVNLSNWPVVLFSQPLRQVAPALFARLQGRPEEMRAAFPRVLRPLSALALPVCVVMAVTAPELVRFVYGEAWAPAAPILRWLAALAALRILFELSYDYLVVLGRSRAILVIQLLWVALLVPVLWVTLQRAGVEEGALALVIVALGVSLPPYVHQLLRAGVRAGDLLRAPAPALLGAVVVGAVAVVLRSTVDSAFGVLASAGVVTAAVAGVLLWLARSDLSVLRGDR